jgi:hypothetical protein
MRKPSFSGSVRKLEISVDGKTIGEIANGKEHSFPVSDGEHEIKVNEMGPIKKICAEQSGTFHTPAGSTTVIECGYNNVVPIIICQWLSMTPAFLMICSMLMKNIYLSLLGFVFYVLFRRFRFYGRDYLRASNNKKLFLNLHQ